MKGMEGREDHYRYDNILMEEAAQILEVETFMPLLLQVKRKMKRKDCNIE